MILERLKSAISSTKLKDKEIVEKFCISPSSLTSIKMKRAKVSAKIALLFEHHFDINPLWLMYGVGEMFEAKFDLDKRNDWGDDVDFDEILENRLQVRYELLKQNVNLSLNVIPPNIKLSDDFVLARLLKEVACEEFKKGLIKQLKMIKELEDGE